MRNLLALCIAGLLIALTGLNYFSDPNKFLGRSSVSPDLSSAIAAQSDASAPFIIAKAGDIVYGDESAERTALAFVSLTCPHCRAWEEGALPDILENLVDTGKLRLVIRDFPLDAEATFAAGLVRCVPESYRKGVHNALMLEQQKWVGQNDGFTKAFDVAASHVSLVGGQMNPQQVIACTQDTSNLDDIVRGMQHGIETYGANSTPFFVFDNGNTNRGGMTLEMISEVISN